METSNQIQYVVEKVISKYLSKEELNGKLNQIVTELADKIENIYKSDLEKKYSKKLNPLLKENKELRDEVINSEKKIKDSKLEMDKIFDQRLAEETKIVENDAKKRASVENKTYINNLESELREKTNQIGDLYSLKAENEKLKRDGNTMKSKMKSEMELQYSEQLVVEKSKIKKDIESKNDQKNAKRELKLQQLTKQVNEMKQKIDQGSSQEDGEIQELIIEKHLRETCPQDKIEEIKKGVTGADTLQIINYDDPQNEVKILYESKNTKVYKEEWIDKLKKDMVGEGASMGVLVTKTFPSGMKKIGVKRGIYILSPLEFKSIIPILRHEVIRSNNLIKATNNKGEKKEMLYQYLIGDAFRLHLESILEAVIDSKNDIEKEKRSLNSIWKKREQQLQKITINFASIYGGIRGIAGNSSFPEMQQFELEEKKKLS